MAVYILHIYIHITVQSCIHKAMHIVLYGKFKSVSEVIRTRCDFFPLLGCGRKMNLEIARGCPRGFLGLGKEPDLLSRQWGGIKRFEREALVRLSKGKIK